MRSMIRRTEILLLTLVACSKRTPERMQDAATPAPTVGSVTSGSPSATSRLTEERFALDAVRSADSGRDVLPDAGANGCRLAYGPVAQPFVGPAALVVTDQTVEIVTHKSGVLRVTYAPAQPLGGTPVPRKELDGVAERGSRPPCAVAGPYAFCSDAKGNVHRALRAQGTDELYAHADAGARVAAARIAGTHNITGFLVSRTTPEGRISEAFAKVDDEAPMRISAEGSGATDLAFAERGSDVIALLIDARRAMSPTHARVLSYASDRASKLALGADEVIYLGGGADRQVFGVLGTATTGSAYALYPTTADTAFGLAIVRVDLPPKVEEPFAFSAYPNGIDGAPIAATHSGKYVYVARVRPFSAEATSTHVLELGKIDGAGAFSSFGLVATNGSVVNTAIEVDRAGAIWVHYTDRAGSWLERRVCPA